MFILDDTIAALASAAGPAGRGIIRCGGPRVLEVLRRHFRPDDPLAWNESRVARRHAGAWELRACHSSSEMISSSVPLLLPIDVYYWPNERSYTGQRQAELHALGSPPLLDAVLSDLFAAGARPAQPGEFTLRAFLAGRLDLLQAEAVLGVIDAADPQALQVALTQLAGGVSQRLTSMRAELLDLLADLEAGLDFTEEGIEFVSRSVLVDRMAAARDELRQLLERSASHARHGTRPRVVLAGPPNAGKSTLFNALVGRPSALVSPIPGTTRDYLVAPVDWQNASWDLVDTAGWEQTDDAILKSALALRANQLASADLVLQCEPAEEWLKRHPRTEGARSSDTHDTSGRFSTTDQPEAAARTLQVITKTDLIPAAARDAAGSGIWVSAQSNCGLEALRAGIARSLADLNASDAGILGSTLSRCRDSLERAVAALDRAVDLAANGGGDEFLATDVRDALDELGRITGAFYTDDLLDRIFSKFCIGK